jgi:hypothetical protein
MQKGRIVYAGDVDDLDTARVAGYLGVGRLLSRSVLGAAKDGDPVVPETLAHQGGTR